MSFRGSFSTAVLLPWQQMTDTLNKLPSNSFIQMLKHFPYDKIDGLDIFNY